MGEKIKRAVKEIWMERSCKWMRRRERVDGNRCSLGVAGVISDINSRATKWVEGGSEEDTAT